MNYNLLFNEEDQLSLTVAQLISTRESGILPRTEIADKLSLTHYQLDRLFEQLNNDLVLVSDDVPSYIDEITSGMWHANNVTTIILQRLQLQYLYRSSLFPAFEYYFFYSNRVKKAPYAAQHHLSRSAFYNALRATDKIVKQLGFFDKVNLIDNQEFNVRLHLFQLYYALFNGIDSPFPKLNQQINTIIATYEHYFHQPLPPTQLVKLRIFLKVWLQRLTNGVQLDSDPFADFSISEYGQAFLEELPQIMSDVELSVNELHYLYFFLLSQQMVQLGNNNEEVVKVFPIANQLTDSVLQSLHQQPLVMQQDLVDWSALQRDLLDIHIQYTSFYIEPTTFTDESKTKFFKDLYPAFDLLIQDFLNMLNTRDVMPVSQAGRVNLYFSYMFALINSVPPAAVIDRVHIFVDFSQGCLYTAYVTRSLEAFNHANLVLESQLTAQTDIYISDFHSDLVGAPQVVWQDPPTPNDWSLLADMILELKKQKLKKL